MKYNTNSLFDINGGSYLTKPYNISIYKVITIDKYLVIDNFYL